MSAPEDLFSGVCASDLRFDNVHVLAEYIARAQRFAESAARIERAAEQLVKGAMNTTEVGLKQYKAAVGQLHAEFDRLQHQLRRVVEGVGSDIAKAVVDAQVSGARYISVLGETAKQRIEGLADRAEEVRAASMRLERAAETAEAARRLAREEFEQLRAFKLDLERFERESQARMAVAKAGLYRGAGLWRRLSFVLFPPTPVAIAAAAPSRPQAPNREAPTSNTSAKKADANDAHARGTPASTKRQRK